LQKALIMADELTIIRDVGTTLKELLEANIPALRTNISFNSPAEMQTPTGNRRLLSLFLYQVAENVHMRNRNLEAPDPERLVHPPVILDLYYLLTPYAQLNFCNLPKLCNVRFGQGQL
jgi:Pvc16 N-terminal domain